ncbi:Pr6Pr family membrane protein [Francisella frigiditurris]|uniref:Putative membrane protein n=1 Tax=Francisella frigiditurris TaxID=1542390 RepID=A0A1J0KWF8_9GAMM|nr:hypothetical protein [Francisella frigiditurris]APC97964.1 putative membrane protein [Francisella frigiditurris]
MKGYLSICRLLIAALALFGVTGSVIGHVYRHEFNSVFELFAQFTYVSNFVVAMILIFVALGKLEDRHIIIPLPSIVLTYIVFSLFLSEGILREDIYSVIEHYVIALYLMFDFIFFVNGKNTFFRSLIFAVSIVVLYLIYVFVYGYLTNGYYPYFFFDLKTKSVESVMEVVFYINLTLVVLFIIFFALKFVQIALYERFNISFFSQKH